MILCPNCCSQNYKSVDKYQSVSINSIRSSCKELVDKIKSSNPDFDYKKYCNQVNKLTTKFALIEIMQELQNIIITNNIPDNEDTSTNGSESVKKSSRKLTKKCADCDKLIHNKSERCMNCHSKHQATTSNRPSYEQLLKDIKETNFTETGKKYNVSDTTIRKWIKKYEKDNA